MGSSDRGMGEGRSMGEGKSITQLHAERIAEARFTDMMASAGVGHNRMGVELLYFIPTQFRDAYVRLFRRALKGDDSDVDASGRRNAEVGVLGKAAGKNDASGTSAEYESVERRMEQVERGVETERGKTGDRLAGGSNTIREAEKETPRNSGRAETIRARTDGATEDSKRVPGTTEARRTEFAPGQTAAISGRGKKYKRYWTVEDERALILKDLIDKRLRRIAREIEEHLSLWELEDVNSDKMVSEKTRRKTWEESKGVPDAEIDRKRQESLKDRIGSKANSERLGKK